MCPTHPPSASRFPLRLSRLALKGFQKEGTSPRVTSPAGSGKVQPDRSPPPVPPSRDGTEPFTSTFVHRDFGLSFGVTLSTRSRTKKTNKPPGKIPKNRLRQDPSTHPPFLFVLLTFRPTLTRVIIDTAVPNRPASQGSGDGGGEGKGGCVRSWEITETKLTD